MRLVGLATDSGTYSGSAPRACQSVARPAAGIETGLAVRVEVLVAGTRLAGSPSAALAATGILAAVGTLAAAEIQAAACQSLSAGVVVDQGIQSAEAAGSSLVRGIL